MTSDAEKWQRVWAVIQAGFDEQEKTIRSENPDFSEEEVTKAMNAWLLEDRPPDAPGRPISRERFKRIFGAEPTPEEIKRLRLR